MVNIYDRNSWACKGLQLKINLNNCFVTCHHYLDTNMSIMCSDVLGSIN